MRPGGRPSRRALSSGHLALTAQGVRSPARRRGSLRRAGSDRQLESGSYGILYTSEQAHPLRQRLRKEQFQVYDALLGRADNRTRLARVGLGKLADITGLPKRSVRRAIKELVALGLVVKSPSWGRPGQREGGAGRRPRQLATEYHLPKLDATVGAGTLLATGDGLDVDADPEGEELEDDEAIQLAARALVVDQRLPELREAADVLAARAGALYALAERQAQMLTGRGIGTLIREAEERRIVSAVAAGRAPPATPFPDTLRARKEAICGATCQGDRQRTRHPAAYQDALRARARWADVVYTLLGAIAALDDVLAQVTAEAPRGGDWRKALADTRMVAYLCDQVGRMAETVEPMLEQAEQSWGRLPKGPPPRTLLRRLTEQPSAVAPALTRYERWAPPRLWAQRNGESPARWLVGRRSWEQAKAAGNDKLLRRLRLAGFEEDWPDPPS